MLTLRLALVLLTFADARYGPVPTVLTVQTSGWITAGESWDERRIVGGGRIIDVHQRRVVPGVVEVRVFELGRDGLWETK